MWRVLREDAHGGASHTQPLTLTNYSMVSSAAPFSRLKAGMQPTTPLLQALNRTLCLFSVLARGNSCLWIWVSALGSDGSAVAVQTIQWLKGQRAQGQQLHSQLWICTADVLRPPPTTLFMMYSRCVSPRSTLRYSNYFPVVWRPREWNALIAYLRKSRCALMSL